MAPIHHSTRVEVRKEIGTLLMLRSTVPPLFRRISHLDSSRVVLDFSGVEFMSRSFADEYRTAKSICKKQIEERKVPIEVRRMMKLVLSQSATTNGPVPKFNASLPAMKVESL